MRLVLILGFVLLIAAAGCGPGSQYLDNGKLKNTIEEQNIGAKYIEVVGIGRTDPNITDATGRKAVSRNAAVVDAQYRLVAIVKGIKIEGGVTIERAMETDSKIKATVDDMIKGAETVKTEWATDDGCIVTMRLDKEGLAKQLGVKFDK